MARGVPSEIRVGPRTYTCRQIADGTGLDISLISRIFRGQRPLSEYSSNLLAGFFGISIEVVAGIVDVQIHRPPRLPRPLGRAVYRITPNTMFLFGRPPVLDRYTSSQSVEPQESEPSPRKFGDFDE